MKIGDQVPTLEAFMYMRDHTGAVFECGKAQYRSYKGNISVQHRSDSPPHNFGGDWHGICDGWSKWSVLDLMSPETKFLCTMI